MFSSEQKQNNHNKLENTMLENKKKIKKIELELNQEGDYNVHACVTMASITFWATTIPKPTQTQNTTAPIYVADPNPTLLEIKAS